MSQDMRKRVHLFFGIGYIAITVIAGICFILSALTLYKTGLAQDTQPFTRELVRQTFAGIAVPVYLCLAMTIAGFVLHLALPVERKKLATEKNLPLIRARLLSKADLSLCGPELLQDIRRQQNSRKLHIAISAALSAVCAVIFLSKACDNSYWPKPAQVTEAMIGIMPLFAVCVLIPLAYIIFTAYFCRSSVRKEIELLKQAPKATEPAPRKACRLDANMLALYLRLLCVAAAIGFILFGVTNNGVVGVIAKAVAICTECIGLG